MRYKPKMPIKKLNIFIISVIIFTGLVFMQCARQGSPSGGPKDETPPEVVEEFPPNKTVGFSETKATISFNEFVSLKDPAKEIFISPPMRLKPLYKTQGKKVIVEFQEALKDSTTYTINFGNAIVDYTEGNPLVNFEYVFSTGDHIDSLSVAGKILNAFDHKPESGIIVMVYQDNNDTIPLDSLPLKVQPKNASKSTKEGDFRINNLAAGQYMLFALEDLNNNFIFDLPNERIAFLDSLISIEPIEIEEIIPADTIDLTDTTDVNDTIVAIDVDPMVMKVKEEKAYRLFLFAETDSTQRLMGKKLIGKNLLQYIFQRPADSVRISAVGFDTGIPDWYILEFNKNRDTVNIWLKPGLPDTIRICFQAGDSIADTSKYILSKQSQDSKGKKKEILAGGGLRILSNTVAGAFDLNKKLTLSFPLPIEDVDREKIHLYTSTDTMIANLAFTDTVCRNAIIDYTWKQGEYYHLLIEDSVFCDLSGAYNDSTAFKFIVRKIEDYGLLLLNIGIPGMKGQYLVQLLTDKDVLVRQHAISAPGILRFEYLWPGTYKLKVIYDTNANGIWDTGKYTMNSLPERVEYYESTVVIRANWDLQEDWQLQE